MSEKLCIFCEHFRWKSEEVWGMGSTQTGPMFDGGDATCEAGQYKGEWEYQSRPDDEVDFRQIILRGQNCKHYKQVS